MDRDVLGVIALFLFGGILLFIWKLSRDLGLDFDVTFKICGTLLLIAIPTVWLAFSPVMGVPFAFVWPISLCLMWVAIWPALKVWGLEGPPVPAELLGWDRDQELAWWAEWYTRWGVAFGILLLGYGVPIYVDRR